MLKTNVRIYTHCTIYSMELRTPELQTVNTEQPAMPKMNGVKNNTGYRIGAFPISVNYIPININKT